MRVFIEDALAEEDGDGDGDGREATRDGARVDGALLALLGGGRGDGRGEEPALGGREKQFNPADISLVGALWSRPDACKHLLS